MTRSFPSFSDVIAIPSQSMLIRVPLVVWSECFSSPCGNGGGCCDDSTNAKAGCITPVVVVAVVAVTTTFRAVGGVVAAGVDDVIAVIAMGHVVVVVVDNGNVSPLLGCIVVWDVESVLIPRRRRDSEVSACG